jgi:hypothetical protein
MVFTEQMLEEIFSYHAPGPAEVAHYNAIRQFRLAMARAIIEHTPPGPDQTAAIRKLRETVTTANSAIALKGKY